MPRDIANHETKVAAARRDESKISADRSHRLIERLDQHLAPSQSAGSEALLHACREQQIFFDLSDGAARAEHWAWRSAFSARFCSVMSVAVTPQTCCPSGSLIWREVISTGNFSPPTRGTKELVLALSFRFSLLDVLQKRWDIFGWIQFCDEAPHKLFRGHPDHFQEQAVRGRPPGCDGH